MTAVKSQNKGRFRFENIVVDFGPNRALDHITLTIQPGEVVGLLGHNGAGKSTFINIASGALKWTSGKFYLDGEEVSRGTSPRYMAEQGVTVIHQEPSLVPTLSVFSNMCAGKRFPITTTRKRKKEMATNALSELGVNVDLDTPVSVLTLGQRQMVDLARGSLSGDTRVLLLDEPTAALGMSEVTRLHALIRQYADKGVAVIYISHRLPDILDICSRIIVLNTGRMVMDTPAKGLSVKDLSEALAPGVRNVAKVNADTSEQRLAMSTSSGDFTVNKGEVVGFFGMAGGEQFDIAKSLFGLNHYATSVTLNNKAYNPSGPRQAMSDKVAYVPQDRDVSGLIMNFPAKTNVLLPWYRKLGNSRWLANDFGNDIYATSREKLHVLGPGGDVPISQFSGGNRQKQLIARWMFPSPSDLLILAQPTQGVDVGAKADIVKAIRTTAQNGTSVIVSSAETDEISSMCDRAYVVIGSQSKELVGDEVTDAKLLETLLELADRQKGNGEMPVNTTQDILTKPEELQ